MWVYLVWKWYATQWPAPDGFHVPLSSEWVSLCGVLTSTFSMAQNATTMGTYLKMPMNGYRNQSSASVLGVGSNGRYWSSTPNNTDTAYGLNFSSSVLNPQYNTNRANCFSLRCFKDAPVIPTSSWTTLYDGSSIASWAWVFYNTTDGLISVSGDWVTWYTIQDKNLWATTVFNQGDAETDANWWYFYQWGNNYWFAHSWAAATSTTQVDASNYWPWKYYSSSTFITRDDSPYDWSSVQNDNLRWWEDGNVPAMLGLKNAYIGEYVENWATQWPAPSGFHVPLNTEWQAVYNVWTALWGWSSSWTNFWIALKLPFAGYRDYSSAGVSYQGTDGYYWSSFRYNANNAYYLYFRSSALTPQDKYYCANGYSIRCFKNSPVIPTSSWTKLYWTSIESWGIFWSSSEWLISLSSDWQTWITIADKNLWASTVWNSGDALSETNCGWYFQWGNNYMFPFTWSVTTSSTQVDASSYWPWNYYSSSTFITYRWAWDSSNNTNLWWWEDGNVPV